MRVPIRRVLRPVAIGLTVVILVLAIAPRRERIVVVECPAVAPSPRYWRSPVVRITNNEITFGGELIATVESVVRDDSPTFQIDALRERLETGVTNLPSHVRRVHLEHEACQAARDRQPDGQLLCPGRTLIVQLDGDQLYEPGKLLMKIINTTSRAGYHAAVMHGSKFPEREGGR